MMGQKRTHNQAFSSNNASIPQSAAKPESKPKMPAPPIIPSFGFALPGVVSQPANVGNSNAAESVEIKKKARKHNSLGLTPKGEVNEDSEDDVDEEAAFAQCGNRYTLPSHLISSHILKFKSLTSK